MYVRLPIKRPRNLIGFFLLFDPPLPPLFSTRSRTDRPSSPPLASFLPHLSFTVPLLYLCTMCPSLSFSLSLCLSLQFFSTSSLPLTLSLSLSLSLALWLYLTRAPSFLILHVGPPNRRTIPHTPAMFHFFARLSRNSNSRCNYNPAL